MHQENRSVLFAQRVDCRLEPRFQIGIRLTAGGPEAVGLFDRDVPRAHFLDGAKTVERDRNAYRVKPCRERRIAPELGNSLEGADESELREVASKLVLAGQAVGETIHAV